ncbi:MAG: hypothetical protein E6R03_02350 [Hyphomicrobiaceae bacterium]|nr:MAG: hypothetical protein E6R03_02350 [Hyphomicrobiaceae bacterium]
MADSRINIRSEDGSRRYSIDEKDLDYWQGQGFRPELETESVAREVAEDQGALGSVMAFWDRAASALSAGLSDVEQARTMPTGYQQFRKEIQTVNPDAAAAGAIAGELLNFGLSPVGGAARQLGEAAEQKTLNTFARGLSSQLPGPIGVANKFGRGLIEASKRAGAEAIQQAVETTAYVTPRALIDGVTQGPGEAAELLYSAGGMGLIAGGAFGAAREGFQAVSSIARGDWANRLRAQTKELTQAAQASNPDVARVKTDLLGMEALEPNQRAVVSEYFDAATKQSLNNEAALEKVRLALKEEGLAPIPGISAFPEDRVEASNLLNRNSFAAKRYRGQVNDLYDALSDRYQSLLGEPSEVAPSKVSRGILIRDELGKRMEQIRSPIEDLYKQIGVVEDALPVSQRQIQALTRRISALPDEFADVYGDVASSLNPVVNQITKDLQRSISEIEKLGGAASEAAVPLSRFSQIEKQLKKKIFDPNLTPAAREAGTRVLNSFESLRETALENALKQMRTPQAAEVLAQLPQAKQTANAQWAAYKGDMEAVGQALGLPKWALKDKIRFQDALESLPDEKFIDAFVARGDVTKLENLKRISPESFNQVKSYWNEFLAHKSYSPLSELGPALDPKRARRLINQTLGEDKLGILFDPDEVARIRRWGQITDALPVNYNRSGSGLAINGFLEKILSVNHWKSVIQDELIYHSLATNSQLKVAALVQKAAQEREIALQGLEASLVEKPRSRVKKASYEAIVATGSALEKALVGEASSAPYVTAVTINQARPTDSSRLERALQVAKSFDPESEIALQGGGLADSTRAVFQNLGMNEESVHAVNLALNARTYLYSQMKRSGGNPMWGNLQPQPSELEIAAFERRVEAAIAPLSVIDHIKDGTAAPEHIETIQKLYPNLYESMLTRVLGIFSDAELSKSVSFQKRSEIARLFGLPLTPFSDPSMILSAQQAYAPSQQSPVSSGGGSNPSNKPPRFENLSKITQQGLSETSQHQLRRQK